MKKIVFFFSTLLIAVGVLAKFLLPDSLDFHGRKVILLLHPTLYNLRSFVYLIEDSIINVKNIYILGVVSGGEAHRYNKESEFADSVAFIDLVNIPDTIFDDEIFRENACTPYFKKLFTISAGVIFTGGDDLPPYVYGQETSLLTSNDDPYRHFFELSFLHHLLGTWPEHKAFPLLKDNKNYLVWAICLGMQTLNVAMGGTLVQDIPSELYACKTVEEVLGLQAGNIHKNYMRKLHPEINQLGGTFHGLKFQEDSFVKKLFMQLHEHDSVAVYSYHHQCVGKVGKHLRAVAFSPDGKVPEVIVSDKFPNVAGFQFHFEYKALYDKESEHITYIGNKKIEVSEFLRTSHSLAFYKSLWGYFSKIINS